MLSVPQGFGRVCTERPRQVGRRPRAAGRTDVAFAQLRAVRQILGCIVSRSLVRPIHVVRTFFVVTAMVAAGGLILPSATAAVAPALVAVPAAADQGNAPVSADVLPAPQIDGVVW